MKKRFAPPQLLIYLLAIMLVLNYSCRKIPEQKEKQEQLRQRNPKIPDNFFKVMPVPGVANPNSSQHTTEAEYDSADNGDDPIVLGQQLNNPYTVTNMQQAYLQLYGSDAPLSATNLYVRFKPANTDQLGYLTDSSTLELQDYPMDYEVVQDGDFYQDPALGTEDIGWLYTVVAASYTPPSGIQYQVLSQLYLPTPDNLLLESFAESIAAGATYSVSVNNGYRYIVRTDEASDTLVVADRLPTPCEIDPCAPGCPLSEGCDPGGGGGGGTYNAQIPRGRIQVQDIRTCGGTTPIENVPVRQARIVCKRWFKIWTGYTDDQGNFLSTRKFNNKVKILLKTENNHAKVSKVRGIRLWQILFPVKKRIGVFNQVEMANVSYLFEKPNPTSAHDKQLPYWVATTTHNSVLEYKQYAVEFGVNPPQGKLKMLITNWGFQRGAGATPMWDKCHILNSEMPFLQASVQYFIAQPLLLSVPFVNLVEIVKNETDIIVGYAADPADYNCFLTSSSLKAIIYHELGHASHFENAGCDYWQVYRTRISNELATTWFTDPYGNGSETNAGVVGLGEMWGNHCEKWFSERHYNNPLRETFSVLQGGIYVNDGSPLTIYGGFFTSSITGLNANFASIENFNPDRPNDGHAWIPQGLCYDLFDNRNDAGNPVIDNVGGYTTQQCFNALQSDVRTIQAFKDRLLQQNGFSQQAQVNALFNEYNY